MPYARPTPEPRPRIAEAAVSLALPLATREPEDALLDTGALYAASAHGTLRPATDEEILDAAHAILACRVRRGRPLTSPRHTRDYLRHHLAPLGHEVFAIHFLGSRHRVIEFAPLFRGTAP